MDSRICQTFTASPAKPEELPILLAWLEPYLKSTAKSEDLIKEAIQVCEDLIVNKSEVNYKSYMLIVDFLIFCYKRATNMPDISKDTRDRISKNTQSCFERILSFLSENVKNEKIDPKYLFHPALRRVPTDYMICTNNPPWFFELAHSFQTIYYICFTTLCNITKDSGDTKKVENLCKQAKEFIETIKDKIGFFMYNIEMKKIENNYVSDI